MKLYCLPELWEGLGVVCGLVEHFAVVCILVEAVDGGVLVV